MKDFDLLSEEQKLEVSRDIIDKAKYKLAVEYVGQRWYVYSICVNTDLPWRSELNIHNGKKGENYLSATVQISEVRPYLRYIDDITCEEKKSIPKPFKFNDYNGGGINDGCDIDNLNPLISGNFSSKFDYVDSEHCEWLTNWCNEHHIDTLKLLCSGYDLAIYACPGSGIYPEYEHYDRNEEVIPGTFGSLNVGDFVYAIRSNMSSTNIKYEKLKIVERNNVNGGIVFVFDVKAKRLIDPFPDDEFIFDSYNIKYFSNKDMFVEYIKDFVNNEIKFMTDTVSEIKDNFEKIKEELNG